MYAVTEIGVALSVAVISRPGGTCKQLGLPQLSVRPRARVGRWEPSQNTSSWVYRPSLLQVITVVSRSRLKYEVLMWNAAHMFAFEHLLLVQQVSGSTISTRETSRRHLFIMLHPKRCRMYS